MSLAVCFPGGLECVAGGACLPKSAPGQESQANPPNPQVPHSVSPDNRLRERPRSGGFLPVVLPSTTHARQKAAAATVRIQPRAGSFSTAHWGNVRQVSCQLVSYKYYTK